MPLCTARSYASVLVGKQQPSPFNELHNAIPAVSADLPSSPSALPLALPSSLAAAVRLSLSLSPPALTRRDTCSTDEEEDSESPCHEEEQEYKSDEEVESAGIDEYACSSQPHPATFEEDDGWWHDDYDGELDILCALLDGYSSSLHAASARHARKSYRSPRAPRASASSLRAVQSHPGLLSAACAKGTPVRRPIRRSTKDGAAIPVARTTGIVCPYAEEDARMQREQLQRERLEQEQQLKEAIRQMRMPAKASNHIASATPRERKSVPVALPVAPERKGAARAAAHAARHLPQQLHTCTSARWRAVLEQRQAAKQRIAAEKALGPRKCALRPQPSTRQSSQAALSLSARPPTQPRHELKAAKLQLAKQLQKQQALSRPLPLVQSTVAQTAAARWTATHPVREAPTTPHRPARHSRPRSTHTQQSLLTLRPPVSCRSTAPVSPRLDAVRSSFDRFRRGWYMRHKAQLMGCLTSMVGLRLADPSPEVQAAFMQRVAETGDRSPRLTFHGTNPINLASIQQHGFLRPGQAIPQTNRTVPVAHGSSFGRGVYSSSTPEYSMGFCHGGSSMFVCAVLMGGHQSELQGGGCKNVRVHHNILVAFDERRIVPMFMLDFDPQGRPVAQRAALAPPAPFNPLRKQERADERKQQQREKMALQKPLLRAVLRAMHSELMRDAQAHKQALVL